jgi:formate dehydrogenase beta subunit
MNDHANREDLRPVRPGGAGKGGRARRFPKGRQVDPAATEEIRELLRGKPLRRDLLIEFLHLIQDKWGHISAPRLAALAVEMRLPQAEVYEVATFYHHFDIVKETETPPPPVTIRVCDSLSCALAAPNG